MGQTLSEPITAKESSSLQNTFMKVGSSSMQGWRISMEDAHTHILTMADDKDAAFFAGNTRFNTKILKFAKRFHITCTIKTFLFYIFSI